MGFKTTGETAHMLGVGLNTIKRWIHKGDLPAIQTPGGHWRVPSATLTTFMQMRGIAIPHEGKPTASKVPRILVIDDDPAFCALLGAVLEQWDSPLEFQAMKDGYSGLMKIGSWCPDVLVLDILMPGINGLEVLQRIRADPDLDAMVILLITSAFDDSTVKQAARSARVAALLPKPLEVQRFTDTLQASLTTSFALRQSAPAAPYHRNT